MLFYVIIYNTMSSKIAELPFEIATARSGVVMRQLSRIDDAIYFESYNFSRPEIIRFEPEAAARYLTLEDVAASHDTNQLKNRVRYGIWDGGTYVGMFGQTEIGDEVEVGYITDSRHTGKGYATLATQTMVEVDHAIYDRIFAKVAVGNDASIAVLQKCGFVEIVRDTEEITLDYRA